MVAYPALSEVEAMTSGMLVKTYNELSGTMGYTPIKKFVNRSVGVKRVMAVVSVMSERAASEEVAATEAPMVEEYSDAEVSDLEKDDEAALQETSTEWRFIKDGEEIVAEADQIVSTICGVIAVPDAVTVGCETYTPKAKPDWASRVDMDELRSYVHELKQEMSEGISHARYEALKFEVGGLKNSVFVLTDRVGSEESEVEFLKGIMVDLSGKVHNSNETLTEAIGSLVNSTRILMQSTETLTSAIRTLAQIMPQERWVAKPDKTIAKPVATVKPVAPVQAAPKRGRPAKVTAPIEVLPKPVAKALHRAAKAATPIQAPPKSSKKAPPAPVLSIADRARDLIKAQPGQSDAVLMGILRAEYPDKKIQNNVIAHYRNHLAPLRVRRKPGT